jgi:hypothetical protein
LGGALLDIEEKVLVVAIATAPADHGAEVSDDHLDGAEGDLVMAVVQDAVEVGRRESGPAS